jgi:hypothetical protein
MPAHPEEHWLPRALVKPIRGFHWRMIVCEARRCENLVMIETLAKLKRDRFILLTVVVGCVICPGFAFLFVFNRDAFTSLEFLKVLMLALAITTPIFLVNFVPTFLWAHLARTSVSAQARADFVAQDTPDRDEVINELEREGRREERQTIERAMLWASALSICPLYLPIALRPFVYLTAEAAIGVVIVAETVVIVAVVALALWQLQRPGKPRLPGDF